MKKLAIIILALCCNSAFAQQLPDYDAIQLLEKGDYKVAEPSVMQAVNYMLTTPFEERDLNRLRSLQFVIKWMTGTPDYSFAIDETATKISKGNADLLGIYMACMTKYCLENKSSSKDARLVELSSMKMLLTYCEDSRNKIKMTKQLKKLSEANQKGELAKAL